MSRKRTREYLSASLPWRTYYDSGVHNIMSVETVSDDVHPGWFNNPSGDSGGDFDLDSSKYSVAPATINKLDPWYAMEVGKIAPLYMMDVDDGSSLGSHGELDLLSMGATAIARSAPTNPSMSLSTFVGELHNDGLPAISGLETIRDRTRYLKHSGDEYLNVEFGWRPLVSDLQSLARTVKKSNKIIHQYVKNSDNKIRRRFMFPPESDTRSFRTGVDGAGQVVFQPGPNAFNTFGSGNLNVSSSHKTWFSGAFRYHVPTGDDFAAKAMRWESLSNQMLGTRLTPEVVWNLAPWSWAIDWFTNTGDILTNISNLGADGLVLQYGYIMDELKYTRLLQAQLPYGNGYEGQACSILYEHKRLKRRQASPYGFGFDFSSLTSTQGAVIAALGLSRAR